MLGDTLLEAMRLWHAQAADGASFQERADGLEKTLRAAWPQTREWKYLCERCRDYGWEVVQCDGRHCGRRHPHGPHEFVVPCVCAKGREKEPKSADVSENFTEAVKVSKPKGFTRFGR